MDSTRRTDAGRPARGARCWGRIGAFAVLLLFPVCAVYPYSVLTHGAIIDSLWSTGIRPILRKRFPAATPDDLRKAHAYAYGGSIIQDMGYYPFGSKYFSDLTHYVRSGDFIANMIREAQDINELAFALGALSHYAADNDGHALAVNQSVPLLYPKLRRKFGTAITYSDDPASHLRTEFAFDVYQSAKNHYAPDAYKDFVGFEVSKPVLERAFQDTYGIRLEQVFLSLDLALGTYRHAVATVLPAITKAAWKTSRKQIIKDVHGITRKKFLYNISRSSYRKRWGDTYQRPGILSRFFAFLIRILPKVGPFQALSFKPVTPEAESLYMKSFNAAVTLYRSLLAGVDTPSMTVPNENFDVGQPTVAGQYALADKTYARLLHDLKDHYVQVPEPLRINIIAYYQDLNMPIATKTNLKDWEELLQELEELRTVDRNFRVGSTAVASGGAASK